MGGRLFTDKLVWGRLKVLGVWSLDSATPFPSAYPAHASGSPTDRSPGAHYPQGWAGERLGGSGSGNWNLDIEAAKRRKGSKS
jgi:hypothetical protein